jgi:hypothetical protein
MKRHKIITLLTLLFIGLTATNTEVAQAEGITAKILEIPMLNVKADNSSGGKTISFLEPYSVEFSGTETLKFLTCESFLLAKKNLRSTWTISGKSESRDISAENVLYTIATTKTGIQCALSKRIRSWWDTPYVFAQGEQSVPMTISISLDGNKITESTGVLRNPEFSQPAPQITGLSRSDVIKGFARFQLTGKVPSGPYQFRPKVKLCPVDTNGRDCGWGYISEKNEGVVIADPLSYGKSATLSVQWSYTNSAGNDVSTTSQLVGLRVQQSSDPIPWSIIEPTKKFAHEDFALILDAQIYCSESAPIKSNSVTCTSEGPQLSSRSNGFSDSKLRAQIKLDVKSTSDGCLATTADSLYLITGTEEPKSVIFKNLGKPKYFVKLQLSSTIDLSVNPYISNRDGNYLKVGIYNPSNTDYGKGAKCHEIIQPKPPNITKVQTGKVDKSSKAYKYMFTVGQNFAKVSRSSDSASFQCKSALQSGMIQANGIPRYLGIQTRLIQSYLQSASGFQGCLDGFRS